MGQHVGAAGVALRPRKLVAQKGAAAHEHRAAGQCAAHGGRIYQAQRRAQHLAGGQPRQFSGVGRQGHLHAHQFVRGPACGAQLQRLPVQPQYRTGRFGQQWCQRQRWHQPPVHQVQQGQASQLAVFVQRCGHDTHGTQLRQGPQQGRCGQGQGGPLHKGLSGLSRQRQARQFGRCCGALLQPIAHGGCTQHDVGAAGDGLGKLHITLTRFAKDDVENHRACARFAQKVQQRGMHAAGIGPGADVRHQGAQRSVVEIDQQQIVEARLARGGAQERVVQRVGKLPVQRRQ